MTIILSILELLQFCLKMASESASGMKRLPKLDGPLRVSGSNLREVFEARRSLRLNIPRSLLQWFFLTEQVREQALNSRHVRGNVGWRQNGHVDGDDE